MVYERKSDYPKPNLRGLLIGEFKDRDGRDCNVQESSSSSDNCLWLGVSDEDPGNFVGGRMHLTQAQVRDLLPILRHFARTGALGHDDPEKVFQVGTWVIGVGSDNKGVYGRVIAVCPGDYMQVQDDTRVPPKGIITCAWNIVDLIWEVTEKRTSEDNPSMLERILGTHE